MLAQLPGDVIGSRYKVMAYIRAGGMQEVYRAQDIVLGRPVALKAPKNLSASKRFKRSAVLSARINHPNVAKTLDFVEFNDTEYLIEEFIEGDDFQRQFSKDFRLLDPYLASHFLHHLAKGLAASHHAAVVHRDLKPSNIMVSSDENLFVTKITDFGIAKMAEEELAEAAAGGDKTITGSLTMMGALPYMAPEMIESPKKAGPPADVWAVGQYCLRQSLGGNPLELGWRR